MNMLNNKNETPVIKGFEVIEPETRTFTSDQFGTIRTSGTPDNPLFCLVDICRVLEIKNASDAKKNHLNQKGVVSIYTLTAGGKQKMLFINESNLYRLIMRSDKPQAEPFQDWVCGEVLPSIRRTGGYMVARPEETPEEIMARALKVADATLRRQQDEIARLQPLADYTSEVMQSGSTYTLTQVAKDLGFASVFQFTGWAASNEILYRQSGMWLPYAKFSGKGLFATRTAKYIKSDNTIGTALSTVVTERGRYYLHRFIENQNQGTKGGAK